MPTQNIAQTKTRLLLALWDLGGLQQEVKRSQLVKRIVSKGKKVADYQAIFDELQKQKAITISKTGYALASPKGLEVLGEGLRSSEFRFDGSIIGTWAANALLKWINGISNSVVSTSAPNKKVKTAIASYAEFQSVVLEVYDKLNYEYNFNDLVPIYRIRRQVGDRVSRSNFNEWLLEMQSEDILQLQGGSLPENDPAQLEDSITTPVSGLRCYAKRLNS